MGILGSLARAWPALALALVALLTTPLAPWRVLGR